MKKAKLFLFTLIFAFGANVFSYAAECGVLAASKGAEKYHNVACGAVKNIKAENKVCYDYPEDAVRDGYSACGLCKPAEHTKVVASKESNKYHLPSCGAVKNIKKENLAEFASPEEAAKSGATEPCGVCKPPKPAKK
jgi:methylphosphotriester-DNA--protein-cysteine methyltransferase